jgi:hypothetical protein
MDDFDACGHLSHPDKWYLGAGDRLTWTPPHPQWLDRPGFWDEAHYYDRVLAPLFTMTLLTDGGRALPLRALGRDWQPDRLRQTYDVAGTGLSVTEQKTGHETNVLASTFTLKNEENASRTVHVVPWTLQPLASQSNGGVTSLMKTEGQFRFIRQLQSEERGTYDIGCTLGLDAPVKSLSAVSSESGPLQPHWQYTPFYETFSPKALGPDPSPIARTSAGVTYLGLHTEVTITPGNSETVRVAFGAAPEAHQAGHSVSEVLRSAPPTQSAERWREHFDRLPSFECSDPYLQRYYWHRWYGLRLFTRRNKEGNYTHPAVYEGPEYFRKHVTYSAQCHMLETRWQPDPSVAQGSLLNFIENQQSNGSFYGHLYPHDADEESFYHTNWGHVWTLYRTHPDENFLRRAYDGLSDYVDYFDAERDPDDSGLYDIWNHYETGQEYMHRYQAVSDEADEIHWGHIFRLKGVDAAVQIYQTKQALAKMADALGRGAEAEAWTTRADTTKQAVLDHMWDPDAELFFDVDPETGEQTGVKAAVCFYPYFTDIVEDRHLPGLKRHLFGPDEFWTPHPVPASSVDDSHFSDVPHWKGERKNCPWNGRVWPMTNSHVAEAICQAALRFGDDELRRRGATFITRFVHMMFDDGDPRRPNCFEHYNPNTGQPCRYRGIDDYQHSWVNDLLIKYAAGIRPDDATVTVDPFPFGIERLVIDDVPVRDDRLGVTRTGDRFSVRVNGERAAEHALGTPVSLSL